MKKVIILSVLVFLAVALYGCNTIKGASRDVDEGWEAAKNLDSWLQENAW